MFHAMYKNICHWSKRGVCIISPATRARNTRPMHKRFTYLSLPRANWSWNMLWIFHGKIVLSNPPSSTPPSAPPCYTPFRNSYKRRNTSNLDSRLKNWKTISPWFSSASRNTRWLNGAQQDVVSAVRRAFTLSSILASHWVQHSRNLSQRELQPPATLSSIDESFGGPWTQRYHDINHSVKGKCDSSPLSSLPFFLLSLSPSLYFILWKILTPQRHHLIDLFRSDSGSERRNSLTVTELQTVLTINGKVWQFTRNHVRSCVVYQR